ncbi:hypothetical protein [Actinospongicola halichondriae]|uniref:hypothetical protein n=1 Tax=Actinospongicola halichondriae TaxID=3236844 RepID=UPI003D5277A1
MNQIEREQRDAGPHRYRQAADTTPAPDAANRARRFSQGLARSGGDEGCRQACSIGRDLCSGSPPLLVVGVPARKGDLHPLERDSDDQGSHRHEERTEASVSETPVDRDRTGTAGGYQGVQRP